MGEATEKMRFHCPDCRAAFAWKPEYAGRSMRCKCGKVFTPTPQYRDVTPVELDEVPSGSPHTTFSPPSPAPAEAAATAVAMPSRASGAARGAIADVVAKYPGRRARPVSEAEHPADRPSPFRDLWLPLALIAAGMALRVAQLVFANEGRGNRWAGNIATPAGLGRSILLVVFEMALAAALMGFAAMLSTMMFGADFGPVRRAAPKIAASAVFSFGVACWIALFNTDSYSVAGLVVALHALIILNWITIGYFFSLDLQEVLLVVAIATLLYAMEMLVLWRQ